MSMQVRVLGAFGSALQEKRPCGFLIDERVILDAGTISSSAKPVDLAKIDHVILSHAHLDHCKDLAFLTDLIFGLRDEPVGIWGTEEILKDIQAYLFNDRIWPDFSKIPADKPIVRFHVMPHRQPVKIGDLTVTAIPVNHPVPADGFLVDNGEEVFVYSGDTGETDEIWELAAKEERLAAVFVETSFTNQMKGIADLSGHLVPSQLPGELGKLGQHFGRVPIYVYHIKPQMEKEVKAELKKLKMANLAPVKQDEVIRISLIRV
jgi:cAMP phosphodiesterase